MATTYNNAQIGVVDASGNLNVIYPITKATNVAYKSTNVDVALTSLTNNKASKKWTYHGAVSSIKGYTTIPSSASEILIRCGNAAAEAVTFSSYIFPADEDNYYVYNDPDAASHINITQYTYSNRRLTFLNSAYGIGKIYVYYR